MMPPQQLTERLLAGGVAGAVSRTAVAPLERLRTMMMADARNTRISSTLAAMWRDGGVRGLFKAWSRIPASSSLLHHAGL